MNRETVVDTICLKCNELELLFPDLDFMEIAIPAWSKKKLNEWNKLWASESFEYNPIYNYDRYEETEDHGTGQDGGSVTGKVSAFNETDFQNANQTINDNSTKADSTHKGHFYGNTGTTSYQEMIKAEREVSVFSTYDVIAEEFKAEFCIMVYE